MCNLLVRKFFGVTLYGHHKQSLYPLLCMHAGGGGGGLISSYIIDFSGYLYTISS